MFLQKHQAFLIGQIRKFFEPKPVPGIPFGKVVFAQPVERFALTATTERLFVEWRPHIGIGSTRTGMIVTTAFVPKRREVLHDHLIVSDHVIRECIKVVSQPSASSPWNKTDQIR